MAKETGTFSSLIDEVVRITSRRDRLEDIQSYANSSIRECNVIQVFERDFVEDRIVSNSDDGYVWEHPKNFRVMRTVEYALRYFPPFLPPGKIQKENESYYYKGPTYFVFAGVKNGEEIKIAYYVYQPRLIYYQEPRPAIYLIPEPGDSHPSQEPYWQYWNGSAYVDTLGTSEQDEAARKLVTNWLIFDWYDLTREGAEAKTWKNTDDARSKTAFSLYKSLQSSLQQAEPYVTMEL